MVGKAAEHDEEPILTSPVIIRKEKEVFEKTPEVSTKRKFKLKSRRGGVACKTNLEDKTEFKRKLQEEEEESVTSPVFKKQKTLVYKDDPLPKTESVLPSTSLDIVATTTHDDE